jgi:hypothetical protein
MTQAQQWIMLHYSLDLGQQLPMFQSVEVWILRICYPLDKRLTVIQEVNGGSVLTIYIQRMNTRQMGIASPRISST